MQVIINNANPIHGCNGVLTEQLDELRLVPICNGGTVKIEFPDITDWKIFGRKYNIAYFTINNRNVFAIDGSMYYVDGVYISSNGSDVVLMEQLDLDDYIHDIVRLAVHPGVGDRRLRQLDGVDFERVSRNYGRNRYSRYEEVTVHGLRVEDGEHILALLSNGTAERLLIQDQHQCVSISASSRTMTRKVMNMIAEYVETKLGLTTTCWAYEICIEHLDAAGLINAIYENTQSRGGARRNESIARTESRRNAGRKVGRELTRGIVVGDLEVPLGRQLSTPPVDDCDDVDLTSPIRGNADEPVLVETTLTSDGSMFTLSNGKDKLIGEVTIDLQGTTTFIFNGGMDEAKMLEKLLLGLTGDKPSSILVEYVGRREEGDLPSQLEGTVTKCSDKLKYVLADIILPDRRSNTETEEVKVVAPVFIHNDETGKYSLVNDSTGTPKAIVPAKVDALKLTLNVNTKGLTPSEKRNARVTLVNLIDPDVTIGSYSYGDGFIEFDFITEVARNHFFDRAVIAFS